MIKILQQSYLANNKQYAEIKYEMVKNILSANIKTESPLNKKYYYFEFNPKIKSFEMYMLKNTESFPEDVKYLSFGDILSKFVKISELDENQRFSGALIVSDEKCTSEIDEIFRKSREYRNSDIFFCTDLNEITKSLSGNGKIKFSEEITGHGDTKKIISMENKKEKISETEKLLKKIFYAETGKNFILSAPMPEKYDKKYVNETDYEMIILATDSALIADVFWNVYRKEIEKYMDYHKKARIDSLFMEEDFEGKIKEILKENRIITFFDLINLFWNNYDKTSKIYSNTPPTILNIKECIKKMYTNGEAEIKIFSRGRKRKIKNNDEIYNLTTKNELENLFIEII